MLWKRTGWFWKNGFLLRNIKAAGCGKKEFMISYHYKMSGFEAF